MSGDRPIPYSRQSIDRDDIDAVVEVLSSSWLTTGPKVAQFEAEIAEYSQCGFGVSFANGTAALHGMMNAIGVEPGDEVIVPAITFVASANAVLYQGGTPVFADVCADRMLIDPADVERKITPNTKAILAVDYAGHPCDYHRLRQIADRHGLVLLADASHSLGSTIDGVSAASLADLASFSFHPVKPITTGEGGMVVGSREDWQSRLKSFRGHGIDVDFRQRAEKQDWRYQMESLGYNYRLSDIQAALGLSQLRKMDNALQAKEEIAQRYRQSLKELSPWIEPLVQQDGTRHSWHLFVIRWKSDVEIYDRDWLFRQMRTQGIGVNVHYEPVYWHPYYQQSVPSARQARCPVAERQIHQVLSLPIFAGMTEKEFGRVVKVLHHACQHTQVLRVA